MHRFLLGRTTSCTLVDGTKEGGREKGKKKFVTREFQPSNVDGVAIRKIGLNLQILVTRHLDCFFFTDMGVLEMEGVQIWKASLQLLSMDLREVRILVSLHRVDIYYPLTTEYTSLVGSCIQQRSLITLVRAKGLDTRAQLQRLKAQRKGWQDCAPYSCICMQCVRAIILTMCLCFSELARDDNLCEEILC